MLKTLENNLEDANILTKSGDIEDLDVEKLDSSYEGSKEYQKNIDEILFYIKQNSNNEEKQKDILTFLETNKNNKYTVSIDYDDNGFVKVIRAKIQ